MLPIRSFLFAIVFLSMPWTSLEAFAQEQETNGEPPEQEQSVNAPKSLPPAYESQMMRLAEILGALHYIRGLCGAGEGQLWRDQMQTLLEKEDPNAERKAQLTARFNRGFRGFRETYRECTDAAIEANNRYIEQGVQIAADIPTRFGQ